MCKKHSTLQVAVILSESFSMFLKTFGTVNKLISSAVYYKTIMKNSFFISSSFLARFVFNFFYVYLFLRERELECECGRGREGDKESKTGKLSLC